MRLETYAGQYLTSPRQRKSPGRCRGFVTPKLLTISRHLRLDPPPPLSDRGTGSQTQRNVSVIVVADDQRDALFGVRGCRGRHERHCQTPCQCGPERQPMLHPYPRPAGLIHGSCEPPYAIVGRDIAVVQMRQVIRNSRHLCKNIKLFQRFPRLLH